MPNVKHYTKQQLIDNLRLVTEDLGYPPRRFEYNTHVLAIASFGTFANYFGSYRQALKEANLDRKNFPKLPRVSNK